MRRREYLAALSLASVSLFVGCSGGGGSGDNTATAEGGADTAAPDGETTTAGMTATEEPTTASGDTSTEPRATGTTERAETAESTETVAEEPSPTPTANGSGGLPDAPDRGTPRTPAGEFTTSAATTPMDADTFVKTFKGRLDDKDLMTGYALNTLADEQVVELTYVADEDNQRKRLEAFAESFVETVERTGGTGGWSLDMTVQTGAGRNVWYTWEVRDEWAVQRLSGELSREEFYAKIEETAATPTTS